MTDQCNNCTYKGDLKACKAAECFQHENWYARQLQAENEKLKNRIVQINEGIEEYKQMSNLATNKIKAEAIREAVFQCKSPDTSKHFDVLIKYANKLEDKQ